MDMSEDELNELRLKAEIIAEATNRTTEAVLEDSLDDGVVNLSNEDSNDKDLVAQLKEAAELIATVQNISAEVSANTVLNGGDNSTEVKVETTLEGDLVDRALESVQRKAEKIKMIVAIVAPILLLLSGGVGLDYFLDEESSESPDDIYIEEIWGCTVMEAENYDPLATNDDGSCYWDDNNGGGGGPPDCSENWRWEDVVIRDFDSNGEGYNNDIEMRTVFEDVGQCNRHMEGYFEITIWDEDNGEDYTQHTINDKFHNRFVIDHHEYDLPEGDYVISINYEFNEDFWEGPSAFVTTEASDPVEEIGCDAYFINSQAYLEESDSEGDAVTMSADVSIVPEEDNCKDRNFEILWQLYEHNGASIVKYEHTTWESGESSDPDGADYVFHTWDNVDEGTYDPKVSLFLDGDKLDEKWIAHTISIEAETSEPETCQINLYGIVFAIANETNTASVAYDLDCGYGETDVTVGYNVSTQLLVYPTGGVTEYITLDSNLHFIAGYAEDIHILSIDNFTDEETTHYDFYWYAIWTNDSGGYEMIERTWLNQEVTHPSEPEEPVECSNLTITSNSLDLLKDGDDDLVVSWNLSHEGPDQPDCFIEVEVMVTIYQNGQYYNVSDFSQNGFWKVYTNSDGNQTLQITSDDCQLFKDLPPGTYEVLMKYRIVGESETSEDHFANSVVIS